MIGKAKRKWYIQTGSVLALIAFFWSFKPCQLEENPKELVDRMFASINNIKTLTYVLKTRERMDGQLTFVHQEVKYGKDPIRVYAKVLAPKKNEGVELLYKEGFNDNKVYVNTNGFPYVNVSLDPAGNMLRKSNQHTIKEVGFDYIHKIVRFIADKHKADFGKIFLLQGSVVFDNKSCYKLVIDYKQFKYIPYTMGPHETATDIAEKFLISDYMILQLNKQLKDYNDVKPGLKIRIPNVYARRTELLIDKTTFLPISQSMYDDKGLFAQYNFQSLRLNPTLSDAEFTADYPAYNFKK